MILGWRVRLIGAGGEDGGVVLHGGQYKDVGVPCE